jgi:glycine oxidase
LLALAARGLDVYDEFVDRVRSVSGMPVTYRRTGTIDVATLDDTMIRFRAMADTLKRRGLEAELVDAAGVRALEPHLADDVRGGLRVAAHGYVAAVELTRALVTAGRRHGAQVIEHGRVHRIARSGSDLVVETARGPLTASAVVLAAGCWSGEVEVEGAALRVPVRPVRGQLLCLAWNGAPLRCVTWSERCYLVPWDDGTLLVGATVEEAGFDERTTVAGVRDLMEAACDLVPHAWNATFMTAKVGLRPASGDGMPIVGRSTVLPNLWYASGHYRNGVLLAPLTGQLVAAAILDNEHDQALDSMRPDRFGRL